MFCGVFRTKSVVQELDYSQKALRELPLDVYQYRKTLQILYLQINNIRDVPKALIRFEDLRELDLSENEILYLPPFVGQLTHLTVLNISRNNLPTIPDSIQYCQELVTVNFSSNPIGRLCEGLTLLRELRHLYLNECDLNTLPQTFGRLCKLEILELRENHLMDLPASFEELIKLVRCDLGCNDFEELPACIRGLESLQDLWLDLNQLNGLPPEFGKLKSLRFLEASENKLLFLPDTFGSLNSLTDLYLHENLIADLPESFGNLRHLTICRLDRNRLNSLPDSISKLENLTDLNLSFNHIIEIPPEIGCLQKLNCLNLDENLLECIPEEIGGCTELTLFSMRNNRIDYLPDTIQDLTKLSILNLVGNLLQQLPVCILTMKSLKAVWIVENQVRPLLEMQVESSDSGERWLTCVVFPQQGPEIPYEEAILHASRNNLDQIGKQHVNLVNFDPTTEEKKSKVLRDPTPYPKDLHSKISRWRVARDLIETFDGEKVVIRKVQGSKISRPHSLLKALQNPVQNDSGVVESNGRDLSLSPDLLMHLPTAELSTAVTNDESSVSGLSGQSTSEHCISQSLEETCPPPQSSASPPPDLINTTEINLNGNTNNNANTNNNNNNTGNDVMVVEQPTTSFVPAGVTHAFADFNSHRNDSSMIFASDIKYSSMESGFEADTEQESHAWYLSPAQSPIHPLMSTSANTNKSEQYGYDRLPQSSVASPKVLFSPRSTASQSQSSSDTITPCPWPTNVDGGRWSPASPLYPVNSPTTLPQVLPAQSTRQPVSSYSKNVTAYRVLSGPRHRRHFSEPDKNFGKRSYHRPLVRPHCTRSSATSGSRYRQPPRRSSCSEQPAFSRERDFAIEHELQTVQKAEVIFSDPYFYSCPKRQSHGTHADDFSNMRRQRRINSEVIYTSDDNSGRNTPENFHFKSKSASSGIDSGVEVARKSGHAFVPMSAAGNDELELPPSPFGKSYEVVLWKNPSIGLGITGGKDGENAMYPGDKGFHVFKVVDGMPAAQCGQILVGDRILQVNGIEVTGMTNEEVVKLLTGPEPLVTMMLSRESVATMV